MTARQQAALVSAAPSTPSAAPFLGRPFGDRLTADAVPATVYDVLRSPGESLQPATLVVMQPRFNYDFSRVRVHADGPAAISANAVNALAYTVGPHVVFGGERYRPHTPDGRWILAHELAHVVQHAGHGIPDDLRIGARGTRAEAEAEHAADAVSAPDTTRLRLPPELSGSPTRPSIQRLDKGVAIGLAIGGAAALIGGAIALIAHLLHRDRPLLHWETVAPDVALIRDPQSAPPVTEATLARNTRVVITDEGTNQPFNAHNEGWLQVRVTVGPLLNKVGWVHRNQLESRPETQEISPEQALEIFAAVSQANLMTSEGSAHIPFHYTPDGCYARAHRMEEMLTEMGYASEKVFALAGSQPLRAPSPYAEQSGSQEPAAAQVWDWHVAPIIKVRDPERGVVETVIDPSLADGPITLAEWEDRMGGSATFTRLTLAQVRDQMGRGGLGQHQRVAVTAPRYTYNPGDIPREESHEEALAEDADPDRRRTIARYVRMVPVHELAALIRQSLRAASVNLQAVLAAIRAASAYVRQQLRQNFASLIVRLKQRLTPDQAAEVDSALGQ